MPLPAYTTAIAPVATTLANGPGAFDTVTVPAEYNYTALNDWALVADAAFTHPPAVVGAKLFTPGTGWALGTIAEDTYGRRWGGVTFVKIALTRTGAQFAADAYGNIADMVIGTFATGYRPARTDYTYLVGNMQGGFPLECAINGNGTALLLALNQPYQAFAVGWTLNLQTCWINTEYQLI